MREGSAGSGAAGGRRRNEMNRLRIAMRRPKAHHCVAQPRVDVYLAVRRLGPRLIFSFAYRR
jgi:hypothetical protein